MSRTLLVIIQCLALNILASGQVMSLFNTKAEVRSTLPAKVLTPDELNELLTKVNSLGITGGFDWLNLGLIRESLGKVNATAADVEIATLSNLEWIERAWKNNRDGNLIAGGRSASPQMQALCGGDFYKGGKPTYDGSSYPGKTDKPNGGLWRKVHDEFLPILHRMGNRSGMIVAKAATIGAPTIHIIQEQGPNATEWALTPLDESIPGDIRQNLTYLREDLLDEAKKNPKAAAAAYTLASDYCDKILNALDQRDLARVNAGYSSAQADANIRVTSKALEARRNYKMSWPQYAREKDQRNEIYRQQSAGADVRKEQIKVDWAKRAVQMRAYLDDLYTKLRAAMR